MSLADQVNQRRMACGREPLRLSHIERAIRFVRGPVAPAGRSALFLKTGSHRTNSWQPTSYRSYRSAARG